MFYKKILISIIVLSLFLATISIAEEESKRATPTREIDLREDTTAFSFDSKWGRIATHETLVKKATATIPMKVDFAVTFTNTTKHPTKEFIVLSCVVCPSRSLVRLLKDKAEYEDFYRMRTETIRIQKPVPSGGVLNLGVQFTWPYFKTEKQRKKNYPAHAFCFLKGAR